MDRGARHDLQFLFAAIFTLNDLTFTIDPALASLHINTYILGDLSQSESHRYFLELIKSLPRECQDLFPLDERSFDRIFYLTGGRMLLIEEYVYQGIRSMPTTRILPNEKTFKAILLAKSGLEQKLTSAGGQPYTSKDLLDVLSAVVNAGCGYVPYMTLIQLVGSAKVDYMIEQNILYYRPESENYSDLQPFPTSSVVTPTGTHALRAMETLLRNLSPKSAENYTDS
uniref:Uncharacterized protein n=1 Tax=Cryptomonas curvata TaxID=233186 RepID=A0A7S0QL78_9CRYP|mmetsp:Transcript_33307/g.69763  ORF Transcript_33307/g.69763 Transcript_33307/m.69763 type:complete len:227 (+) Transcript_33307:311-991(+)